MAAATDAQLRSWRGSGKTYQEIAVKIAEWATGKERGTVLPDNDFFGVEASGSTFKRAKRFLVAQGVLNTNDGRFQVALRNSARSFPRRPD